MRPRGRYRSHASIRAQAVVSGPEGGARRDPPVSTASLSVISPGMALQVAGYRRPRGPCTCTSSAIGQYCGPTIPVEIGLPESGCKPVMVNAIVAPIPAAIGDVIVGHDYLQMAKPVVSFPDTGRMSVSCRRGSR